MSLAALIEMVLSSPVLVACVTGTVAVLAGRQLIEAKDQRIEVLREAHAEALRAKDIQIEMLQRVSPSRLREDAEAVAALLQMKADQLEHQLAGARAQLETRQRGLDAAQRALEASGDSTEDSARLQHAIDAAADIGSGEELSDVIQRVLRRALAAVCADRGSISRLENDVLVLEADLHPPDSLPKPIFRRQLARSRLGAKAIRTGRPQLAALDDGAVGPDGLVWMGPAGVRHVIQCPLMVDRDVVGLLGLARVRDEPFTDVDVQLLEPFATLAALLLRYARLLARARQVGQAKSALLDLAAEEPPAPRCQG